jgi:hypothetical protein
VYSRQVDDKELTFGVSGLLYKANVLMYDRQTESLWSQVRRESVAGPLTGAKLKVLPSTLTTWKKWRKKHPDTHVLSLDTGHDRDYSRDPYESYYASRRGFLSFFQSAPGEEEKEMVVGIELDGVVKAYPLGLIRQKKAFTDTIAAKKLAFTFDPATDQLTVRDEAGNEVPFVTVYWFVWKGMYPETSLQGSEGMKP